MIEMKYYVEIDETKKPAKVISATTNPKDVEGKSNYIEVDNQDYINVVGWTLQKRTVILKDGKPEIQEEKQEKSSKKKD